MLKIITTISINGLRRIPMLSVQKIILKLQ